MNMGMVVTFAGIVVAGLAGVLGVWMERNPDAPSRWAWVFSGLILVAMGIETTHSIAQATEDGETSDAMARVLDRLSQIAAKGDNPALEQFVGAELAVQARSNPAVMRKLERKVTARGGDPLALRKKAAAGRRAAAGLPPRAPARPSAVRPGSPGRPPGGKAPGATGPKVPGEAGVKAKAKAAVDGVVPPLPDEIAVPPIVPAVPGAAKARSALPPVPGIPEPSKAKSDGKAGKNP